jgi:hypothetical protein
MTLAVPLLTLAIGMWPLGGEGGRGDVIPPDQIWIETSDGAHWTPSETLFPPNFDYIEYTFVIQLPHQQSGSVCFHVIYDGTPGGVGLAAYTTDSDKPHAPPTTPTRPRASLTS